MNLLPLYIFILLVLVVPHLLTLNFLWKHRNENGIIKKMRGIIAVLVLSDFAFFCGEIGIMVSAYLHGKNPALYIILPRIIFSLTLAACYYWALAKLKKIQDS